MYTECVKILKGGGKKVSSEVHACALAHTVIHTDVLESQYRRDAFHVAF